jgi:hypothetical protein
MDSTLAYLGVLGGLITFAVGLWQYHKAQRWKVLEFVAQEIKQFWDRPLVAKTALMLDYENLPVELFPATSGRQKEVAVDEALIVDSLLVHQERGFNEVEVAVRQAFDQFFEQLERFDQYIESGLVRYADFHPYLRYWLRILTDPHSGVKTERLVSAVREFLTHFEYHGVLRLLGRYRRATQ